MARFAPSPPDLAQPPCPRCGQETPNKWCPECRLTDKTDDVDADLPPLPAGTPRCDCGLALTPYGQLCPVCDLQADVPLEISDEPLPPGCDPLDITGNSTPF